MLEFNTHSAVCFNRLFGCFVEVPVGTGKKIAETLSSTCMHTSFAFFNSDMLHKPRLRIPGSLKNERDFRWF